MNCMPYRNVRPNINRSDDKYPKRNPAKSFCVSQQKTIDAAKALLAKVQVGQEPGQYQESPVKALEEKIKVAESVVKDTKVKDQYVETMNRTLEYAMQLVEKSVNK